jgi:hypothetical protein
VKINKLVARSNKILTVRGECPCEQPHSSTPIIQEQQGFKNQDGD